MYYTPVCPLQNLESPHRGLGKTIDAYVLLRTLPHICCIRMFDLRFDRYRALGCITPALHYAFARGSFDQMW